MEHPNIQLVRNLYEARSRGDRTAIRNILAEDIYWHDPYPPPHGGDLQGIEAVFHDVFDEAGELTGGSTRLWIHDIVADDELAVVLVYWTSTYRGKTMNGKEVATYRIANSRIVEAWFQPANKAASDEFFA